MRFFYAFKVYFKFMGKIWGNKKATYLINKQIAY